MSILFGGNSPLTPISLNQRPYSVRNSIQNSNRVFQPLESNSCKITKKKDFFSPTNLKNKTFYNERKKSDIHPLDFYTLGKIPSNTVYPNLEWNRAKKSTSNDIIYRNALSINTKKYNEMNIYKKASNIYEQNITDNNYMEPVKIYKTYEKYNIPNNATNKEVYNLMKAKFYSRDIHSSISQGKCLSQKEFMKEKEKMLKKDNLNLDNINSNRDKKHKEIKKEEMKPKNKNENNKNEDINEKSKSLGHNSKLIYRDPNDYTKQELKSKTFYFDKNNNQMLREKHWIIDNKK